MLKFSFRAALLIGALALPNTARAQGPSQCVVSTAAPTYGAGQTRALSCDTSGRLRTINGAPAVVPGGAVNTLQYNSAGSFGGVSGWTTDGANALTGGASATLSLNGAILTGDAANTLAQRNGTTAQKFSTYNTYTDASNYERSFLNWSSNNFNIGNEHAGTGSARVMQLLADSDLALGAGSNVARWRISTTGHFTAETDNAYDIGASAATRPRNIFIAGTATIGSTTTISGGLVLDGSGGVGIPATKFYAWTARANLSSPADGIILLANSAVTDFTRLQFGGTTSSFPAIKRGGNAISLRLADDTIATFSTLTACATGLEGALAAVSDSTTVVWGATITGTGANHVLAYCDGTNWTVAAK